METSTNEHALAVCENAEKGADAVEMTKKQSEEEGEIRDDSELNMVEEEDVPDDFFDDFSNQDFMDGLDIVDAWDDSDKIANANKEKGHKTKDKKRSGKNPLTGEREKKKRRRDRSHDKVGRSRESDKYNKELSPSPPKKRNELELRRDPLKTKRDLEKDRENYVKKKEQKLISKVVETGLVPPGMEMEVDLFDIDKVSKDKKLDKDIEKTKRDITKSKEKSREKSREVRRRRSRSFSRPSPIYRTRERSLERWRSRRDRSQRTRSRERSRRTRSRERSVGRIIRDISPFSSHRRRRSISDRERWLLHRSESPERKYKNKIGEEKLSFLEELKIKLDGLPSNSSAPNYPYPVPVQPNYLHPTPTMFPNHPMPIQPPVPQYFPNPTSPYDQNFFIGDAQPVPQVIHNPNPIPAAILPLHLDITQSAPAMDILRNSNLGLQRHSQTVGPVPAPVPTPVGQGLSDVSKLMEQIRATTNNVNKPEPEEKKLSLTDYLSINKKPTAYSTNSEAFKRKINVLSRCQDVLNEFSGDKRPGGKLTVRKCGGKNEPVPLSKSQNMSPLLRKAPVQFSFSSIETVKEDTTFQNLLNKVLTKCGLAQQQIVISDDEDQIQEVVVPKAPEISTSRYFKQKNKFMNRPPSPTRVLMKMCQTDPISCEECMERKKIKYKDVGVQCGETDRYNVGVQVVEADIINSRIGKNQSLAYLTPAQLLGRSEPTSTKIDNFRNPFVKPTPMPDYRDFSQRDPRGYTMQYPDNPYPGSAIRDPRFSRF